MTRFCGARIRMDVVLEVFDTFLFDRLYASFLPKSSAVYGYTAPKNASSTFTSMRELPTAIHASSTQFFHLAPSQYADMSAWPRDHVGRQTLTLYLITWSAGPRPCSFQTLADIFSQAFRRRRLFRLRNSLLRLRLRPRHLHPPEISQEPSAS